MQFISAPLARTANGSCDGCGRDQVVLTGTLIKVEDHPTKRNAVGKGILIGVQDSLICGECCEHHPIWKLEDIEPKTAAPRASEAQATRARLITTHTTPPPAENRRSQVNQARGWADKTGTE